MLGLKIPLLLLLLLLLDDPSTDADERLRPPGTDEPLGINELLPLAPGDEPPPVVEAELGEIDEEVFSNLDLIPTGGFENRLPPLVLLAGRAGVGVLSEEVASDGFWNLRFPC